MLRDAPRWAGTETACAPLLARREARLRDILGADVRRDCALEMASQLRLAKLEAADPAAPPPAVTESLIDAVRASVREFVLGSTPVKMLGEVNSFTRGRMSEREGVTQGKGRPISVRSWQRRGSPSR